MSACVVALVLLSDGARAEPNGQAPPGSARLPTPAPSQRREFSRITFQIALGAGRFAANTGRHHISGTAGTFLVALGWQPLKWLAVQLSLWGAFTPLATIEDKRGTSKNDTPYDAGALGPGITLRLPHALYLSSSLAAGSAWAARSGRGRDRFGLLVVGGGEWVIGGNTKAGMGLSYSVLSLPDAYSDEARHSVWLISILGSVCFN